MICKCLDLILDMRKIKRYSICMVDIILLHFIGRLLDKLTLNTLHEVVLPIYPKSPDYHYLETFKAIRDVYNQLVEEVGANNIVMMGDGSGGGLALSFVQSLINDNQEVPRKLFLLSPLLDATLTNPNITKTLEENDILVSRFGVSSTHEILDE